MENSIPETKVKTKCTLLGAGKVRFEYGDGSSRIRFLSQEEFALVAEVKEAICNHLVGPATDELFDHYLFEKESKELKEGICAEIRSCNTVTS